MKDLLKWSTRTRLVLFTILVVGLTFGLTGCFGLFGTPPTANIAMDPAEPSPGNDVTFDLSDSKAGGTGDQLISYSFKLKKQSPSETLIDVTQGDNPMNTTDTENWTNIVEENIQTGDYKAELTVTDGEGKQADDSKEFNVS